MAKQVKGLVFVILLLVGLFFVLIAFTEQSTASISAEQVTNCPNPQFAQNETIGGVNVCNTVPIPYSYIMNISGTTITAYPTTAGFSRFTGTDCSVVVNDAVNALIGSFAQSSIYFKTGVYTCQSTINQKGITFVGESSVFTTTGTILSFPNTANGTLTTTGGGLRDLTLIMGVSGTNVNTYLYKLSSQNVILQNVKFRCPSVPFNTCGTAINVTLATSASQVPTIINNVQTTGYLQTIYMSPSSGRLFANGVYCNSCNTVINDSGSGFNYFNGIDTTTKDIAVYLASGVQHDYINSIFNSTVPIIKDNSGQINYIETGQTGNVACPALSGGVLTNTLGDKINVIWAIGTTVTTISQDGTNVFTSTVNIPVPLTVTLNAGETTTASQTLGVTEKCFYN